MAEGARAPIAQRPSGPNLVARCLWAERGWQTVALGLDLADPAALRVALADLDEHQRLHGWVGELGDGLSWMISVPATCPPAALVELSGRDLEPASGELYAIYARLARVFAETGLVDRALVFLDAIGAGTIEPGTESGGPDPREGVALATARLYQRAGRWQDALDTLESPATHDPSPAALAIRARSAFELGRTDELEHLVVLGLPVGDDCVSLELLIEAWHRTGTAKGQDDLRAALEARLGHAAPARTRARIESLWDAATAHTHLLSPHSPASGAALVDVLDGPARGAHEADVLARLAVGGTGVVDDLLGRLAELSTSTDPHDARLVTALVAVLAETGDPRVPPALEVVGNQTTAQPLERWRAANALRRDLEEVR